MQPQDAADLGREAIVTALALGAPVLIVGMVVGLVVGLLQALTQVQDQTVSFVPKIVAMVIAAAVSLPWLIQTMVDYTQELLQNAPTLVSGG